MLVTGTVSGSIRLLPEGDLHQAGVRQSPEMFLCQLRVREGVDVLLRPDAQKSRRGLTCECESSTLVCDPQ